jgi:hypothetical protein
LGKTIPTSYTIKDDFFLLLWEKRFSLDDISEGGKHVRKQRKKFNLEETIEILKKKIIEVSGGKT